MGSRVLWRCDDCGGPANWTFINGEPHYLCHDPGCRAQFDMFKSSVYYDKYGSVSALEGEGVPEFAEQKIQK